jgi:hypothetical protein
MAEGDPEGTLNVLHADLGDVKDAISDVKGAIGDVKGAIGDLKTTMIAGFAGMPTRESSDEMIRLLRENNRIQDARLTQTDSRVAQLDLDIHEQHARTQQTLAALSESQQGLTMEIHALIRRIDALIRGRNNGESPPGAPPA